MSTSVASLTTNFFPSAENGFSTTTSGSVASGATTVGLASVAGYTNGEVVVFVIDPTDASKKQVFTGVMDTAGSQVTSVVWTAGTNQTHALGATVVDYATATHMSMVSKGILQQHKQSGAHSDVTADSIVVTDLTVNGDFTVGSSETAGGYLPLGDVPDTVTANGNRSYDLVFNGNDLTDTVSPGMRLKLTRTVTAPTQCTDLESGSSQYYSKTSPSGLSFTTTFTCSAWIKMESYPSATAGIIARRNADTEGWGFHVNPSGQLVLIALRIAGNNKTGTSYQSIPLNRWVHVAASMDVSVAGDASTVMYIDGVAVPSSVATGGTCTALVQGTTALVVGSDRSAGANYWDGKLAQVAVYSAVISAANIRATISQGLTGSETSLVSAYSFNNSINDLSANANNLTAQGSAVATNADTPFTQDVTGTSITAGTTNYAIITKASFSTNTTLTVQVPEGDTIPTSGGVSAVSYSTQKVPYGFPAQKSKWMILGLHMTADATTSNASYGAFLSGGWQLVVPPGAWKVGYTIPGAYNVTATTIYFGFSPSALTGLTHAQGAAVYNSIVTRILSPSAAAVATTLSNSIEDAFSTTQTFIMYTLGSTTSAGADGSTSTNVTFAECAYL